MLSLGGENQSLAGDQSGHEMSNIQRDRGSVSILRIPGA